MSNTIAQVAAVFGIYVLLELLLGRFPLRSATRRENGLDVLAFTNASLLVGPLIVYGSALIERAVLPGMADAWIGVPWWWKLAAFLVFEDMVQYWYHRATHRFAWMWPFHKFHHTPEFMGVRIIWRNSFLYDLAMPNLWLAGILVYLGFGDVYFWYYLVKLVITMGAHSTTRWDEPLYRYRVLHPLAWVVERTISTPATHFAHHARDESDGIGHYNGNFGNLLFFWDVLFGTARITRQYPPAFGVPRAPGEEPDPWYVLIFYPLFRAKRPPSP
ncbi:MAG TPA: sterol desaturase family protein [Nevskiaceae bacterium]|nr:sterol desaturase family protein [Nevskiaceae bacterium]